MRACKFLFPPMWLVSMFFCGEHGIVATVVSAIVAFALGAVIDVLYMWRVETPSACNGCRHCRDCAFSHNPKSCNGWVAPFWMRPQRKWRR